MCLKILFLRSDSWLHTEHENILVALSYSIAASVTLPSSVSCGSAECSDNFSFVLKILPHLSHLNWCSRLKCHFIALLLNVLKSHFSHFSLLLLPLAVLLCGFTKVFDRDFKKVFVCDFTLRFDELCEMSVCISKSSCVWNVAVQWSHSRLWDRLKWPLTTERRSALKLNKTD